MRAWLLAPALLLLQGCAAVDPVESYRAAARSLEFRLEAIRPRLDLQLPPDRSSLVLGIDLEVKNPSQRRLAARSLGGKVHLEQGGGSFFLGEISFPAGVELEAQSTRTVRAELRLPYRELRVAWPAVQEAVLHQAAAVWRLEGKAALDLLGVPFELPLRASKGTGGPRP